MEHLPSQVSAFSGDCWLWLFLVQSVVNEASGGRSADCSTSCCAALAWCLCAATSAFIASSGFAEVSVSDPLLSCISLPSDVTVCGVAVVRACARHRAGAAAGVGLAGDGGDGSMRRVKVPGRRCVRRSSLRILRGECIIFVHSPGCTAALGIVSLAALKCGGSRLGRPT